VTPAGPPRSIDILGRRGAEELLDVLQRTEAERAALIGRLWQRTDVRILADALIDLDEDEIARHELIRSLDAELTRGS
jgi:hypothetical protein